MKYTECANGHVYDSDQYAACPYCNHAGMEIQFGPGEDGKTVAPGACRKREELSNRTVAVFQQKYGLDPVVGWPVGSTRNGCGLPAWGTAACTCCGTISWAG